MDIIAVAFVFLSEGADSSLMFGLLHFLFCARTGWVGRVEATAAFGRLSGQYY
jgi:hypothetical protein